MADAVIAARARIDRALASLERKVIELKSRSNTEQTVDDDLFAIPPVSSVVAGDGALKSRIAELEQAGRDASAALAHAADELRAILGEQDDATDAAATDFEADEDVSSENEGRD